MLRLRPGPLLAAAVAVAALAGCESNPFRTAVVETRTPGEAPPAAPSGSAPVLRFSVATIESPRDTYYAYSHLFARMGELLHRPIRFEQRRTYREVNDLIISGQIDAALVCTGGYLDLLRRAPNDVEIVAVPVVGGAQSFSSLIIAPAASDIRELSDLRGRRIAFTDELSFSGRLYALGVLREHGLDPERSFSSVILTGSHDRSIQAVASGLVDGAAVHGGVLDAMEARDPALQQRIRVLHRSPPLGGMPVVASTRLSAAERAELRRVLLSLDRDPDGAASLKLLRFDRFAEPTPGLYASAARILDASR